MRSRECVFEVDDQKDGTISQMAVHSSMHYLLATSTSGSLGVYDLRKPNKSKEKLHAMSDQMDEEYLCLALCKVSGSHLERAKSDGWDFFRSHSGL